MVDSKRYDPTITRFQKHTKSFVSGKTKKGHLNNEDREAGDVINEEGVLVRIIKKDIQGKGWEVKVDGKPYKCSYYGNSFLFLPNCTETDTYYIPKKECKVEISIDKKSKIYTITKIKGLKTSPNQQLISIIEGDKIDIKGGGKASVSVKQEKTAISGDGLEVEGDVEVSGDVKVDTSKDKDLPDKISMTELYKKVQVLEEQLDSKNSEDSDTDGD